MRIVAWNCRMGFAKKRNLLYQLRPDVAVISECSRDSMLACKEDGFDSCWWGENKNKGLGVLARKPWALEPVGRPGLQPRQRWIAPVRVQGPLKFLLLAVWAGRVGDRRETNYVGQVHEAIVRHPNWFGGAHSAVICGDFNSNTNFDHGRKRRTHSRLVQLLSERGLVSAYHTFFSEDQGKESRPTYYFWCREKRPFHLDYIFLPIEWSIKTCTVGTYKSWRPASDHVPIVVEAAAGMAIAPSGRA
jgi:exodeoxyribonuclease-3